jgi:hypothetical protein
VSFIGPPGVGKRQIASPWKGGGPTGIQCVVGFDIRCGSGRARSARRGERGRVIKNYLELDLLITDDMGLKAVPERGAEILLEIIVTL